MSANNCEQENHILDQINGRQMTHKMQSLDINRIVKKPSNTPMNNKGLKMLSDKSSRKAFGNVSNVLQSGTKHSIGAKKQMKIKASTKESVESTLKSEKNKSVANETQTESKSKFSDEIEDMYPIEEELMSDIKDSMTRDLFTIDEKIVLEMGFDSDMSQCMLQNKQPFDLNFL